MNLHSLPRLKTTDPDCIDCEGTGLVVPLGVDGEHWWGSSMFPLLECCHCHPQIKGLALYEFQMEQMTGRATKDSIVGLPRLDERWSLV